MSDTTTDLVPDRAYDAGGVEIGWREGIRAAAPIIIAEYIHTQLIPDADQGGTDAWLAMHARNLDPEGDHA